MNTQVQFPKSAWTGVFANYRDEVAGRSEAPESFHFAALASVLGVLFGRRVFTHYALRVYLGTYWLLIGKTGVKKTSAITQALALLPEIASGRGIVRLHGLSTAEGLITALAKTPDTRLLVVENELRGLLKKSQVSSNGNLTPLLCQLYDAPEQVDLPTRGNPLVAERPLVGLVCAGTPESLEDTIGDLEVYGGLLNRIIPVAGDPRAPQPWPTQPAPKNWQALAQDIERALARYPEVRCLEIRDPLARQTWEIFYRDLSQRHTETPDALTALTHRLHTHVMRLALLFAVVRGGQEIDIEDLTRALELGTYINTVIEDVVRPLGHLGGQVKTGQSWTGQNRPVAGRARRVAFTEAGPPDASWRGSSCASSSVRR